MNRRQFLSLAALTPLASAQEAPPAAADILRRVRESYALQDHRMTGRLRDQESGRVEPLELSLKDSLMRFRFLAAPPEDVQLDLSTEPATLWRVRNGSASKVAVQNAAEPVRGMDFNHEDLSLRFLYWKQAQLLDADARLTAARVKCWLVRVTSPDRRGPYYTVDLWVHQDSGGVARMDAYNDVSTLVKRFEVTKMWKLDGASALREMRVQSFDPKTGDPHGMTYLTLDKPEQQ